MLFIEKAPLPGRLDEIELTCVDLEHWGSFTLCVFTFHIDNDTLIVNYNVDTRLWHILLNESMFSKIPLPNRERLSWHDAIDALRKLLTYGSSKKANHIKDLKAWQEKLKVFPAKVCRLNSPQESRKF